MASEFKDRTLSYFRVAWMVEHEHSISLEMCIAEMCSILKNAEERSTLRNDGQVVGLSQVVQRKASKGWFLHITSETPGDRASALPTAQKKTEKVELSQVSAPVGHEFMDSDAFLFVIKDSVFICSSEMRVTSVEWLFRQLFAKARIRKDSDKFTFLKAANSSKIALINRQGVRSIELNATISEASASYNRRRDQAVSALGTAARHIKAIFGKQNDVTEDAINMKLILTIDKRRKGIHIGEKRLIEIAKNVVKSEESEDDYVILTKTGETISESEIYIKEKRKLKANGKSVGVNDAWNALEHFYKKLDADGILDE